MLPDYLISLIRTVVPAAVGAVLAWAASTLCVVLDSESSTALTAGVVTSAVAGYYAPVRGAARRRDRPTVYPPPARAGAGPSAARTGPCPPPSTASGWPALPDARLL